MVIYKTITLINAMLTLFLGLGVYLKNRKSEVNKIFSLFCINVGIWGIFYFLWLMFINNKFSALFFARGINISAIFIPITYFHFILVFLKIYQKKKRVLLFGYLLSFFLFVTGFTNLFVKSVKPELSFAWYPKPGITYHIFSLMFLAYVLYSWYLMINSLKKVKGIVNFQIKYILVGTLIGFIGGATTFFPVYGIQIPPYGSSLVIIPIILTTFAILKYHLFGIRIILTELLVGVMGIFQLVFSFLLPGNYKFLGLSNFSLFLIFAYYLLKVIHREERRREEAERMAERERKLRMEIERLSKAKDQFILSVQHYFRTPLTSIIGYLSLILENFENQSLEEIKRKLKNVFTSAQELRKRIEEGLTIAAFQTKGGGVLNFQEVKFEDFIKEIFEELRFQAESKKLEYELKVPKIPLPKIKIDPQRMKEAISNLIDNAIKYTQKGGVFISLEQKTKSILLKISDTGIGIPKEELSFLGQSPFERGEGGKKITPLGKGIGLYLSRLIIEAHGGKLEIESEGEGNGTTVYVELPTPLC